MKIPDRSLKENIVRIDAHPLSLGVLLFDLQSELRSGCGLGGQFGVMADEVEGVVASAVSIGPDGCKRVDCGMLGVPRLHRDLH